jgi:lysozyme family protein
MSRFDICFKHVIGLEGGYVNHPHDPGGETMWGITRRDHPGAWVLGRPTLEQAKDIYRTKYWRPAGCEELPEGYDLVVFDAAINQGVRPSVMLLQRALNVDTDGHVGPETITAARLAGSEGIARCLAERALRYAQTRGFDRFGLGWLKRTYLIAMEVGA